MNWLSSTGFDHRLANDILPLADAIALVETGARLLIAGRGDALRQLPEGNWIGGTTPYVMTENGGAKLDGGHLFVTDLGAMGDFRVALYGPNELEKITSETPEGGMAIAIIPAHSRCHERFAHDAPGFAQAFMKPTFGWIAGYDLDEPDACAWVFAGSGHWCYDNRVAVLHLALPEGKVPHLEFVNLFEPDGVDIIRFHETGFSPSVANVNGRDVDFAAYVRERGLDHGRLPLVGDYAGARVNSSVLAVEDGYVAFYAPVFPGVDYCFARPVGDYAKAFAARLESVEREGTVFSCNCILNYLFGKLEGKAIGGFGGPITFGEIAFQLHNQTLIEVRVV